MMRIDKRLIFSQWSEKIYFFSEEISFGRVELEEVSDEEENDKRSSTNNIHIPSTVEEYDDETNASLERLASNLVDSVLNDILLLKNLDDEDDTNTGVRELSDDENGLRELDENDMSGTDEFILFATKAEVSDDDEEEKHDNPISSTINRGSLNRLYTFSRTNDDGTINSNSKITSSNQVCMKRICTRFFFEIIIVLVKIYFLGNKNLAYGMSFSREITKYQFSMCFLSCVTCTHKYHVRHP